MGMFFFMFKKTLERKDLTHSSYFEKTSFHKYFFIAKL